MSNQYRPLKRFTLAAIIFCSVSAMSFASIEVSFTDCGWYSDAGVHQPANLTYIVRTNGTGNHRNFFVFDLSGVTQTIVSAVLKLENPQSLTNSINSTYTLYDVSTSVATLVTGQSSATAIYADLGSGVSYGSATINSSVSPGFVEISLNAAAISAMNSASGLFALGGALSAVGSTFTQAFSSTNGPDFVRTLTLEVEQTTNPSGNLVPEPVSLVVWSSIALVSGLGWIVRRTNGR